MEFNEYRIDVNALRNNVRKIRANLDSNTKFCAMVKADAYGHCVRVIAPNIEDIVDFFGVANIDEARQLVRLRIKTPILIVGVLDFGSILWCTQNNVRISITSFSDAEKASKLVKKPLKVHIKINTGMNRFGFSDELDLKRAIDVLRKNPNITIEGAFTHFATKTDDRFFIVFQFEKFLKLSYENGLGGLILHCNNSFATVHMHKFQLCMCRIGFLMYGTEPTRLGLEPVLSIKSHLIEINHIKKGDSVGYGRTFFAKHDMRIGVVPLGYADGFDRRLSNRGFVLVSGKRARVVGRICMDVFMIDLSGIDDAKIGDEVCILGRQGNRHIRVDDYARLLDTSEYDILLKFRYRRMKVRVVK